MKPVWPYVLLGAAAFALIFAPPDDSDAGFFRRSGVSIVKDYKTGCEYLSRLGGLTPRLVSDGKHLCK